jgi:hypothetical protein
MTIRYGRLEENALYQNEMKFHMSRNSESSREPALGWPQYPPQNGLPNARPPWGEPPPEYHPHHQSPVHEHNGFVYSQEPPMYAASSMPPPRTTYQQLRPVITSPQMPIWPSELSSQSQNYNSPPYSATAHLPSEPRSAPVSGSRAGRSGTQPRKTLTDQDRRDMCKMAERNPTMKQTEIGGIYLCEIYNYSF